MAALDTARLFRGSSAVEQPAVNRLVVGSNPTRGAIHTSENQGLPALAETATSIHCGTMLQGRSEMPIGRAFLGCFANGILALAALTSSSLRETSANSAKKYVAAGGKTGPLAYITRRVDLRARDQLD